MRRETADKPRKVVRDEERVLPGVALAVVVVTVVGGYGVERRAELAARVLAAHETGGRVEQLPVTVTAVVEVGISGGVAGHLCHLRHAPVGYGIFHVVGHRFFHLVARYIAILLAQPHATLVEHGRLAQGIVCTAYVGGVPLGDSVGKDADARVAHHGVGFTPHKVPHRQFALLVVAAR